MQRLILVTICILGFFNSYGRSYTCRVNKSPLHLNCNSLFMTSASFEQHRTEKEVESTLSKNEPMSRNDSIKLFLSLATFPMMYRCNSAQAFCGEPYPAWAYDLQFDEGLVPFQDGDYSSEVFVRIIGTEKREKKVKRFPLVLIPSAGLSHTYLETIEAAASDERRVILWDPIGTGASIPEKSSASMIIPPIERQLEFILSFFNIKAFHLLGQGTGATLAISAAKSYLNGSSKRKVLSAILSGPILSQIDGKDYSREQFKRYSSGDMPICLKEALPKNESQVPKYSNDQEVPPLSIPLLLIFGSEDSLVSDNNVKKIASAYENCRIARIDNAGHMAHLDKREEYLQVLLPFLQSADAEEYAVTSKK